MDCIYKPYITLSAFLVAVKCALFNLIFNDKEEKDGLPLCESNIAD